MVVNYSYHGKPLSDRNMPNCDLPCFSRKCVECQDIICEIILSRVLCKYGTIAMCISCELYLVDLNQYSNILFLLWIAKSTNIYGFYPTVEQYPMFVRLRQVNCHQVMFVGKLVKS